MRLQQIALIACLFLYACGNRNSLPSGILKPAKMQVVLWDILRADAFTFDFIKKDSTKHPEAENVKLQQQVFAQHKISREDFYNSYAYYKKHPEVMQPLLDSIINKATRDKFITPKVNDTLK